MDHALGLHDGELERRVAIGRNSHYEASPQRSPVGGVPGVVISRIEIVAGPVAPAPDIVAGRIEEIVRLVGNQKHGETAIVDGDFRLLIDHVSVGILGAEKGLDGGAFEDRRPNHEAIPVFYR